MLTNFQSRRSVALPTQRRMLRPALPKLRSSHPRVGWISKGDQIIEAGDPFLNDSTLRFKVTPTGLTESELLSSLNYLDEDALQGFNSIGPVLAKNIVSHRTQIQYYASLEELINVPQVGTHRFDKLVGRKPLLKYVSLHSLMRVPYQDSITMRQISPWRNPAPGIQEIVMLSKSAASSYQSENKDATLVLFRIGVSRLIFNCTKEPASNRASYILKRLPRILRSINYERSLTPTN